MTTVRQFARSEGQEHLVYSPGCYRLRCRLRKWLKKTLDRWPVMEGDELVGIITEMHYARNVVLKGKASPRNARAGHHGKTRRHCHSHNNPLTNAWP